MDLLIERTERRKASKKAELMCDAMTMPCRTLVDDIKNSNKFAQRSNWLAIDDVMAIGQCLSDESANRNQQSFQRINADC